MENQKQSQQTKYLKRIKESETRLGHTENSKTWNKLIEWNDHTFLQHLRYKSCYDKFLQILPEKNASVLEIACSNGSIAKYMLNELPNLKWMGIDESATKVAAAIEYCPQAQFVVMDARALKSWREKFDALVIGFGLSYFSPAELCDYLPVWIKRVEIDGLIYIGFVEGNTAKSGTQVNSRGDAIDFYYYTTETIEQALQDCGVKIEYIEKFLYPKGENNFEVHSVIIARRVASR